MSAEHGGHGHGGGEPSAPIEQATKSSEALTNTTVNIMILFIMGFLFFFGINNVIQPESHGHGGH